MKKLFLFALCIYFTNINAQTVSGTSIINVCNTFPTYSLTYSIPSGFTLQNVDWDISSIETSSSFPTVFYSITNTNLASITPAFNTSLLCSHYYLTPRTFTVTAKINLKDNAGNMSQVIASKSGITTTGCVDDNYHSISGPSTSPCGTLNTVNYTVPSITGATSYSWSFPATWTALSPTSGTSITLQTDLSSGGTISCNALGCNTQSVALDAVTVTRTAPARGISGDNTICSGETRTYTFNGPTTGSVIWNVSAQLTTLSSTSNTITVRPTTYGGFGYITANNNLAGCSTTPSSVVKAISLGTTAAPPATTTVTPSSTTGKYWVNFNFGLPAPLSTGTSYNIIFAQTGRTSFPGNTSGPTNVLVKNGDIIQYSITTTNRCGTNTREKGYQLVSGVLRDYILAKRANPELVENTITDQTLKIYPNPVKGSLNIQLDNTTNEIPESIVITDLNGTKIDELVNIKNNNDLVTFNTSNYINGLYLININYLNKTETQKILIEN